MAVNVVQTLLSTGVYVTGAAVRANINGTSHTFTVRLYAPETSAAPVVEVNGSSLKSNVSVSDVNITAAGNYSAPEGAHWDISLSAGLRASISSLTLADGSHALRVLLRASAPLLGRTKGLCDTLDLGPVGARPSAEAAVVPRQESAWPQVPYVEVDKGVPPRLTPGEPAVRFLALCARALGRAAFAEPAAMPQVDAALIECKGLNLPSALLDLCVREVVLAGHEAVQDLVDVLHSMTPPVELVPRDQTAACLATDSVRLSAWTSFSECDAKCGIGHAQRSRKVFSADGTPCGTMVQRTECAMPPCVSPAAQDAAAIATMKTPLPLVSPVYANESPVIDLPTTQQPPSIGTKFRKPKFKKVRARAAHGKAGVALIATRAQSPKAPKPKPEVLGPDGAGRKHFTTTPGFAASMRTCSVRGALTPVAPALTQASSTWRQRSRAICPRSTRATWARLAPRSTSSAGCGLLAGREARVPAFGLQRCDAGLLYAMAERGAPQSRDGAWPQGRLALAYDV